MWARILSHDLGGTCIVGILIVLSKTTEKIRKEVKMKTTKAEAILPLIVLAVSLVGCRAAAFAYAIGGWPR